MLAFRKKKMSIDDFNPVRSLGEGAYGEVLLVKLKATKKEYAMKVLDKAHIAKEQKEYQVLIEKQALSKLSHPNFVKLHFSFQVSQQLTQDEGYLYMVLDYVRNGDLHKMAKTMSGSSSSW